MSALTDQSTGKASPPHRRGTQCQFPKHFRVESNSTVRRITPPVSSPGVGSRKQWGLMGNYSGRGDFPGWIYGDPSFPTWGVWEGRSFDCYFSIFLKTE